MGRAADFAACFENARAARAMNRAVDAAPAEQRGVRGVHDRVDVLEREIADDHDDAATGELRGKLGSGHVREPERRAASGGATGSCSRGTSCWSWCPRAWRSGTPSLRPG